MKYLNIIDELFSSDSGIFLLIGLLIALIIGLKITSAKKAIIGLVSSFLIYAFCEVILNIYQTYLLAFIMLFVGTIALGCLIGFLIALLAAKIRKKGK